MQRFFVLTSLIMISLSAPAQAVSYPKNYFRNPLGITMELAANFGELRPDHWHMGLDLRTEARENFAIYAAADGYISRIGIRPKSFGRFIVINHPNGLSTLYAHLNDFYPALEEYVTARQYEKESWAVELDFAPEQFPVSKGAFIAYSGNTGGSQGPHLHFEIFDTKTQKRLNPLLFGFPVKDDVPPNLIRLAMYDRSKSVYEQTPVFFNLKKTDSGYVIPKMPVINTGLNTISFAIQAYDRMSGSANPNGIYSAKLYLDDEPQVAFVLDSIDYDETAYLNAHVDYKLKYNGGAYVQHLSQLPGDKGVAYKKFNSDGVIRINDTSLHAVSLEVKDAAGNTSKLNFFMRHDDSLAADYRQKSGGVVFSPGNVNVLEKPSFELYASDISLYDTTYLNYFFSSSNSPFSFSEIHHAGDVSVPLHESLIIRIKLNKPVPEEWQDKLIIQRIDRKGKNFKKATWQEQWVSAKFDEFGAFQVLADAEPPQINNPDNLRGSKDDTVNLSAATRIVITPTDNFGIRKFRAELNGRWIRFTNDKSRNWVYKFDERCPYGIHNLKVKAEDWAGNITVREWWFKREPYSKPPPKKPAGLKTKKKLKKEDEKAKKAVKKKKK